MRFICTLTWAITALGLSALPAMAELHPGDTVAVVVYNHPDLSARIAIDGSGYIWLPLAGSVDARNAEPKELAERVRTVLSRYMPKVAVEVEIVSRNQSIFVSGGPGGVLPYVPGETLADALAQLQSPQGSTLSPNTTPANLASHDLLHGRVDMHHVSVLRDGSELGPVDAVELAAHGQAGPTLLAGDTIRLVDKPIRVEVQGDVREPGVAYLDPTEPLSDAILQVGGYVATSASSNIVLQRGDQKQLIAAGGPELAQPAQNGDVVTIPRAARIGVLGAVQKPGDVILSGDTTLLSALYDAGGPVKYANIAKVIVTSGGSSRTYDVTALMHGAMQNNPTLHDGDMVFVPEGHKIDLTSVWQALSSMIPLAAAIHYW
jgi:protein involved in polysaccharide export with SLBB domain